MKRKEGDGKKERGREQRRASPFCVVQLHVARGCPECD